MNDNFLFPHRFKKLGWFLLLPGMLAGLWFLIFEPEVSFLELPVFALAHDEIMGDSGFFSMVRNNITDELIALLIISGSILVAFSKEAEEDEYINQVRLSSLVWATYVNYAILFLTIVFIYGMSFFWVLVINMFTILLFFIVRFNWVVHYASKRDVNEE